MGQIEHVEDYHVALNLDQRLDKRTHNVSLTSEVAAVWVEGSELSGQFQHSVVLQGKDRSIHGIRSYHACYGPLSYPLFFPRGELGWHDCFPKVRVTMDEVNAAHAIRKARSEGDDEGNSCNVSEYYLHFRHCNIERIHTKLS
jgi:hypothetical protein